MHDKASAVVQALSPKEGCPAPVCRVLRVLELMPQVITWVRESFARSGACMALGLVRSRYTQTNVDKITASIPTRPDGREVDMAPVFEFCTLYACRAAKMVDHTEFVFDAVPPNSELDEVAEEEPATEYLFSRASSMAPAAAENEASTSSARATPSS